MRLITSIPPRFSRLDERGREMGTQYLKACIESWRENGFDPASINRPDEVSAVKDLDLIEVITAPEEGAVVLPGKFGPSLGAVFDVLDRREPVVITNADIFMLPHKDFAGSLRNIAQNSFVIGRRTDISALDGKFLSIMRWGFDLFAFNPRNIEEVMANPLVRRFQLGAPWWDYVLPLASSFHVPISRINEPTILHQFHDDRWDPKTHDRLRPLALEALRSCRLSERPHPAQQRLFAFLKTEDAGRSSLPLNLWEFLLDERNPVHNLNLDSESAIFRNLFCANLMSLAPTVLGGHPAPQWETLTDGRPHIKSAMKYVAKDFKSWLKLSSKILERSIRGHVKSSTTADLSKSAVWKRDQSDHTPISFKNLKAILGAKASVILEIGANDGTHTEKLLSTFPAAKVFAFECDSRAIELWTERLNAHSRAELQKFAIGAADGEATFFVSDGMRDIVPEGWHYSGSIRKPKAHLDVYPDIQFDKTVNVPVRSLDSWIAEKGIKSVDLIWADVQGAEGDLIKGGIGILKNTRYLFTEYNNAELYEGQLNLEEILQLLPWFEVHKLFPEDVLLRNKLL